ncbi:hypothetical protein [Aggregatibacter kilianii]|uniref:hypothetical protein n=1 Tax=Aggregatibacter kilianii TaxID=2025884 RepID=UPI000D64C0AE|nr:hypothetical protein [Aggregatibacter kilianii]
MKAKLTFEVEKLVLTLGEQEVEIPLSIAKLQAQFTPYPPSEMAWETAIMQVEDAISPYRDALNAYSLVELHNATPLQVVANEQGQISSEMFECAFAVLAGYRPSRDLPALPHNAQTAAFVLIMREWMHHLGFEMAEVIE